MQCIIFAAGKGSRMGGITTSMPKHLIQIKGKPILAYVLESLPKEIDEIIIIISHLGEQIESYFGYAFSHIPIKYVIQDLSMKGTAGALWSAQNIIKRNKFLVLNGDDIHSVGFLQKMINEPLAIGVIEKEWDGYLSVRVNKDGNLYDFVNQDGKKMVSTGVYTLNHYIFNYQPDLIKDEYNLPRAVLNMAKDYPIKVIQSDFFLSCNTPEDLKQAEGLLK